jgi:DNA invertase Pin-like site-specific DNA recombinase
MDTTTFEGAVQTSKQERTTMAPHVAIYVRVSTTAQDTRSQEPELKNWTKGRTEPIRWYEDKASGKSMDRPAWNELAADIRAGKVAAVVVWRLDRLGRTAKGLTTLFDELRGRKVNLVSLKEGLDLSTSAGRLMANVLAGVAQYETEVRGERVAAGQAAARAAGKRWGGSKPGLRKKVTPTQAKMILHMKQEGEPITAIAKAVKLSRPTIYDVLAAAGKKIS